MQLKIAKLAGEAYDDGLGDIIVAHEGIMLEVDKRERSNSAGSLLTVRPGDESEGGFLWPRLYRLVQLSIPLATCDDMHVVLTVVILVFQSAP